MPGARQQTSNAIASRTEEEIYQQVYDSSFRKVKTYIYSFLKDNEEAENVAHDTFMSLWENKDKMKWNANLNPWLFSVAKNKCLNILKHRIHSNGYIRNTVKEKSDYLNYLALQAPAPIKLYEKEVESLLGQAIEKMTPKVRSAFILSRIRGLKHNEIAEGSNISSRTVEARIKSAMIIIRQTFKDYI